MKKYINVIEDFPKKGISFKDFSPLLANRKAFKQAIEDMGALISEVPDYWVGIDARGFIFAPVLSYRFGGGAVMCRKSGKLPEPAIHHAYQTEYSEDKISLHSGVGKVVIVDDLLATGGTLMAAEKLCQKAGYEVIDRLVLMDLTYVPRAEGFSDSGSNNVKSLIRY